MKSVTSTILLIFLAAALCFLILFDYQMGVDGVKTPPKPRTNLNQRKNRQGRRINIKNSPPRRIEVREKTDGRGEPHTVSIPDTLEGILDFVRCILFYMPE